MPVHGPHSLDFDQNAFAEIRIAIEQMLEEDGQFTRTMRAGSAAYLSEQELEMVYWQLESDGSIWPTLDAIMTMTMRLFGHRSAVYHSGRHAAMTALGYPEGFSFES